MEWVIKAWGKLENKFLSNRIKWGIRECADTYTYRKINSQKYDVCGANLAGVYNIQLYICCVLYHLFFQ